MESWKMRDMNRRGFLRVVASGLLLPEMVKPRSKVFDLGRWRGYRRIDPWIDIEQGQSVFRSVRDGRWSDPATWGGLLVPQSRSQVEISHRVVLDCSIEMSRVFSDVLLVIDPDAEISISRNYFEPLERDQLWCNGRNVVERLF
jgi:hypothetical protein